MTAAVILISFLLLITGPIDARSRIKKTEKVQVNPVITAIDVSGNHTISTEKIMDNVFTRLGDVTSNEKIQADLKGIYSLGYFSDVTVTFETSKSGTKVTFKVIENPVIETINIFGNTVYATEELISMLKVKTGEILSFKDLRDDIKNIDQKYHNDGYVLEKIVDVSTDKIMNKITIEIQEGHIDDILIKGNDNTKDYVIMRELSLRKGNVFNDKILSKDLRRVFNLGFFSDVTPNIEPSSKGNVFLIVNVKESHTGSVNFGGGYGEREGWFGFTDLSIDNIFGTGQGVLLRGQFGQQLSTYQARYYNPWILPDKTGDHTSFTARRWYTVGRDIYQSDRSGIYNGWDMSFGKPAGDNFKTSFTFGSERVFPTDTSTFEPYLSNTIGFSISYDTRDVWMNPSTGSFHTLSVKQGWKYTDSVKTLFSKYSFDFNQFFRVADKQTIGFHSGLGLGFGDIPIGEVYWIGGANTVRGYSPYESHSGTRQLLTNLEYRYTVNETFQAVLFFDWGDAWNSGGINPNDFLVGRGFGVRLNTPMGPIRLDYGVAGGKSLGEGITHFSIGQAF